MTPNNIVFDWTINPSLILNVLALLVGGVFFLTRIQSRFDIIAVQLESTKDQLKALTDSFSKISDILTKVALQDQRLGMIEKQMDELRHGQGYIRPSENC